VFLCDKNKDQRPLFAKNHCFPAFSLTNRTEQNRGSHQKTTIDERRARRARSAGDLIPL
jgi:hypothetical protein